jgi:site-specific DNA recombinase
MNAAVYLRVSTEEQATSGYGLDAQQEKVMAMAIVKGWTITNTYTDDVSGTKDRTQRPGLDAMLNAACSGKVGAVIVAALDRLGRSTRIVLDVAEQLDKCGAELVSCKESIDTTTASGRFVFRMFASLAELDRDNIVQRTTDGRNARGHINGERGGMLPMGYIRTSQGIEIDNAAAAVVRDMFEDRADGATLTQIADALNKSGITTQRGGGWHASSVRAVLNNEDKYRGGQRWESNVSWPCILEDHDRKEG